MVKRAARNQAMGQVAGTFMAVGMDNKANEGGWFKGTKTKEEGSKRFKNWMFQGFGLDGLD